MFNKKVITKSLQVKTSYHVGVRTYAYNRVHSTCICTYSFEICFTHDDKVVTYNLISQSARERIKLSRKILVRNDGMALSAFIIFVCVCIRVCFLFSKYKNTILSKNPLYTMKFLITYSILYHIYYQISSSIFSKTLQTHSNNLSLSRVLSFSFSLSRSLKEKKKFEGKKRKDQYLTYKFLITVSARSL